LILRIAAGSGGYLIFVLYLWQKQEPFMPYLFCRTPGCDTLLSPADPNTGSTVCPACGTAQSPVLSPTTAWEATLPAAPVPVGPPLLLGDTLFIPTHPRQERDSARLQRLALADGRPLPAVKLARGRFIAGLRRVEPDGQPHLLLSIRTDPRFRRSHSLGQLQLLPPAGEWVWRWQPRPAAGYVSATTVVGDTCWVTAVAEHQAWLAAVELATGKTQAQYALTGQPPLPTIHAPAIVSGRYAFVTTLSDRLLRVDLESGAAQSLTIGHQGRYLAHGPLPLDDNRLLVVNTAGQLFILDAEQGQVIAEVPGAATGAEPPSTINSSPPAGDDHRLYIGLPDGLLALSSGSGEPVWRYKTERSVTARPVVNGETLLVAGHDHRLTALSVADGVRLWQAPRLARRLEVSPLVTGNVVIVADREANVTAFTLPHGPEAHLAGGELEAAARLYDQAGPPRRAARLWQLLGRPVRQARALERQGKAENQPAPWEAAAAIYTGVGLWTDVDRCRAEIARLLGLPRFTVTVTAERLLLNQLASLNVTITNSGYGLAQAPLIRLENKTMFQPLEDAEDITRTRHFRPLAVGESQTESFTVKPAQAGLVPLRIAVCYTDAGRQPRVEQFRDIRLRVSPEPAQVQKIEITAQSYYEQAVVAATGHEEEHPMMSKKGLQEIINQKRRRLEKLQLQEATSGLSTDPGILIQIEDLQAEVAELRRQLVAMPDDDEAAGPAGAGSTATLPSGRVIHVAGNYIENAGDSPVSNISIGGNVGPGAAIGPGASVQAENIAGGDININSEADEAFAKIMALVESLAAEAPETAVDVRDAVEVIQAENDKGEEADERIIRFSFRTLARMAPDIFEVAAATLANPVAGLSAVVQKIAKKAAEEKK
jgi:hypothetical protein